MTIAAGFVHRDGILLCADTEHTGYNLKSHAPKVRHFECVWGRIGIAYAGNADNATAVSQKLEKLLKPLRLKDPLPKIEELIDGQYRRLVHRNPNQDNADFALLIVVRSKNQPPRLYVTSGVAVLEVDTYRIIGIGETFGEQLVEPGFVRGADSERILLLALHAMALVKRHVPFCGGLSMYLDMRKDGTILEHYGEPFLERLEKWVGVYHLLSWNLLNQFASRKMSDADFARNLEYFAAKLIEARQNFADDKKLLEMRMDAMRIITQGKA
jgi:20S proteasome alpha/beta subunit